MTYQILILDQYSLSIYTGSLNHHKSLTSHLPFQQDYPGPKGFFRVSSNSNKVYYWNEYYFGSLDLSTYMFKDEYDYKINLPTSDEKLEILYRMARLFHCKDTPDLAQPDELGPVSYILVWLNIAFALVNLCLVTSAFYFCLANNHRPSTKYSKMLNTLK